MNPFRDALELRPRPSRRLLVLVLATHLAASAVIIVVGLRQPWLWLLTVPVTLSLAGQWRMLTGRRRIVRLQWRPDGLWRWERADGRAATGALAGSSVCTPQIVLLHLRARGRRWPESVAVLPDSVAPDRFRRLRAQLRLHGRPVASGRRVPG